MTLFNIAYWDRKKSFQITVANKEMALDIELEMRGRGFEVEVEEFEIGLVRER